MRVVIFFQFLILFLLKTESFMQAAVASAPIEKYASAHSNQLTTPNSSFNKNHSSDSISYTDQADQDEYLVTEDVEEDECPNAFARKSNSLARNYSTQLHSSLTSDSIHRSKAAQCFYGRISYKYIQQRVLRVWSSAKSNANCALNVAEMNLRCSFPATSADYAFFDCLSYLIQFSAH